MEKITIPYSAKAIQIDHNSNEIIFSGRNMVIPFSDISLIQTKEVKGSMGKGGIARAFSSTFFGDQHHIATSMILEIKTKTKVICLEFIQTPIKSNTVMYTKIKQNLDEVLKNLNQACPEVCNADFLGSFPSYIEELQKLKELLDIGVLTPQEFEDQKNYVLTKSRC